VPGQPFGQQVQARLALEIIVFAPLAQTDSVAGAAGFETLPLLLARARKKGPSLYRVPKCRDGPCTHWKALHRSKLLMQLHLPFSVRTAELSRMSANATHESYL
jgi:hypothetical protein